jgi:hypothetical protein
LISSARLRADLFDLISLSIVVPDASPVVNCRWVALGRFRAGAIRA